jgi:hypothetical protein
MNMKITINRPTEFEVKFLKVDAGVRYWEDAEVNGVSDSENPPTIPCAEFVSSQHKILIGQDYRWRPLIDIETGQIVNWEKGFDADVHYKVCDDFQCDILDKDMDAIESYDGYVPSIMCPKENGYGDYIIMDIDANGFIQDWNKELIRKLIKQED